MRLLSLLGLPIHSVGDDVMERHRGLAELVRDGTSVDPDPVDHHRKLFHLFAGLGLRVQASRSKSMTIRA